MSSQPKKILLLGAGFTTQNMGVWALASGAITSALHAYPGAQVYLLDYHSEPATYNVQHPKGTALIRLINIRFSKRIWLPNNIARLLLTALTIRALPFQSFRNRIISRNKWLRHIQTSDIVGSVAGGDSFSDIYGIGRLIYVVLPQVLVLILGKPLVLLPQTIGPFKSAFARAIATFLLRHSKMIYSRDHNSLQTAKAFTGGGSDRLGSCYDMGFVLKPKIEESRMPPWIAQYNRDKLLVGINVSGLLYIGGYKGKNMFGLKVDYPQLIRNLIHHFITVYDANVMLVPHVLGEKENRESDIAACYDIIRKADIRSRRRLHIIEDDYDQHELKAIIGKCDFFIGSRMHACIAALSQCIPTVGLAYSQKFRGVFASIGMEDSIIDLRNHDEKEAVTMTDLVHQRCPELRAELKKKVGDARESVLSLFQKLPFELCL